MDIVVPRSKNHWENYLLATIPATSVLYPVYQNLLVEEATLNKAMNSRTQTLITAQSIELGGYVITLIFNRVEITT